MNERVVEILVYLMTELRESQDGMEHIDGLSKDLKRQGYTDNEINAAFSWLFERIKNDTEQLFQSQQPAAYSSFRMLHEAEKLVIMPEAYGYILQLYHLGLLTLPEMEQVIERAMMLGTDKVDVEDIKAIIASLFFNSNDPEFNFLGKALTDTDGIIH